ncbi:MAG: S8 family serine peptidase, partial [Elusimicrobia bacterium]|nr:S8 family serine peptidase [Elusimicrobiota bacterium]
MKVARTLLASVLAAALVLLSPGSRAWAQAAEAAAGADFGAAQAARVVPVALAPTSALSGVPTLAASASLSAMSAPAALAAPAAPAAASAVFAPALAEAPSAAAAEPTSASAMAAPAASPAAAVRASPVSTPLAEASRALSVARDVGARAGALDRLFTGARRALGLTDAPSAAVTDAAAFVPALAHSVASAAAAPRATVPALSLALGSLGGPPSVAPAAPQPGTATLVVVFDPSRPVGIRKDLHLSSLNARRPDYVQNYQRTYGALMADVAAQGVTADELASFNASPVASYHRINAATFALDAAKAEAFAAALRLQGHKVYSNERRRIIAPIAPTLPQDAAPAARASVTMAENLKITRADAVQAIARARWGAPDMNPWSRALQIVRGLLTGDRPVQPKIGVVDSGADTSHPLLKRVKQVQNFTSGPNADDIGHGSWVTSMVLNYAPWLSNLTHYKTFTDGGATLDDILKSLTAAANDGNLVISNSWGSDDGDPESPDSVLVKKLAQEGHILVFAAGNAGPGANTIGSPAIVQFKDP